MSIADDILAEALALVNEFGKTVTYLSMSAATYSPATSTATGAVAGTYIIQAVVEPGPGSSGRSGLIAQNSKKITIVSSSMPVSPAMRDKIQVNGVSYVVVNIDVEYMDDIPVVYTLVVERG